ncbi:unnamed protein product [Camellia sinensis]
MIHGNSDSDVTSQAPSSPRSPKRPLYYVQTPSRYSSSRDGDKSTLAYTSPMDSPSHSSTMASSASRVSGHRKRNEKGWPECEVIEEEGDYEDYVYGGDDEGFRRRSQCLIGVLGFVSIFTLFCLIIWGAARPYGPRIAVQSLIVNNFYFGEGTDGTGVPTKLLTVNCSVKMMIHNPATFFGIHVSSNPVHLFYSQIAVATGQLKKYYQPRKSQRIVSVNLEGNKVPLYGAGGNIEVSDKSGGVPFRLEFDIRSQGNVVGKLVKTMHKRHISCNLLIGSSNTKSIKFKNDSCSYD